MKIPGVGFLRFHLITRPLDVLDIRLGRRRLPALIASACRLTPLSARDAEPPSQTVVFLTGNRFLYQTIFSAYSLLRASGRRFRLRIINDGSLTAEDAALLNRLFPSLVSIEPVSEQEARIERLFPRVRFPNLRRSRDEAALFRKLLDVHGGETGWTLFIDSDTYFHRAPTELLACLDAGTRACCMCDHWSNYGHPQEMLSALAGHPILPRINSGLVGLPSGRIDWDLLERRVAAMRTLPGQSVFYEQGLTALLLSSLGDTILLPPKNYALSPTTREVRHPTAAFHHYAGNSKYRFVRYNVPAPLFHPL